MKELVESGVHFGHRSSRWNPKMRPYIYARRNLIHIIDVRETVRGLLRAARELTRELEWGRRRACSYNDVRCADGELQGGSRPS